MIVDTPFIDAFHLHLDHCRQCREHPMQLCPLGHRLLIRAGAEAEAVLSGRGNPERSVIQ